MEVRVLLFAAYRETAGWSERTMDVQPGETAGGLWARLTKDFSGLSSRRPLCAVNESHVALDRELSAGDAVAFFPPVSGGGPVERPWSDPDALVTAEPLDAEALAGRVRSDDCGALCSFIGVVRDHHDGRAVEAVTYEAYPEMAGRELARLCSEAESRWEGVRALAVHRTGRLSVGEASVVIHAAAPHRAEAFEACRFLIEQIKVSVPVWKKDHFCDGPSSWRDD